MKSVSETKEGPIRVILGDGTVLFTRYTVTVTTDIQETSLGPLDFGKVVLGPSVEWVRRVDGSEYRGSHLLAMESFSPRKKTLLDRVLEIFY